jgi:hypothetical protein
VSKFEEAEYEEILDAMARQAGYKRLGKAACAPVVQHIIEPWESNQFPDGE